MRQLNCTAVSREVIVCLKPHIEITNLYVSGRQPHVNTSSKIWSLSNNQNVVSHLDAHAVLFSRTMQTAEVVEPRSCAYDSITEATLASHDPLLKFTLNHVWKASLEFYQPEHIVSCNLMSVYWFGQFPLDSCKE